MALCPGLLGWASTRKVKPIWILVKQETVSGSGIGWTICKSAPLSRQITTPTPHRSVFYRPDALPVAQPTASKHWRQEHWRQEGFASEVKQKQITLEMIFPSNLLTYWSEAVKQGYAERTAFLHRKNAGQLYFSNTNSVNFSRLALTFHWHSAQQNKQSGLV